MTSLVWRGSADVEMERPFGDARVVARSIAAAVRSSDGIPAQQLVFFGGPITAPGYDYHTLASTGAVAQRLELRFPVPFLSMSLGRFGRSPATMTLAPFVNAAASHLDAVYPSAGLGALLFFDLLRVDVSRGLRDGRWSFYLDVNRAFWPVL